MNGLRSVPTRSWPGSTLIPDKRLSFLEIRLAQRESDDVFVLFMLADVGRDHVRYNHNLTKTSRWLIEHDAQRTRIS